MKEEIKKFQGEYNGVEPDGEHWLTTTALYKLLAGDGIHMSCLIEHEGEKIQKTITVKHGPGIRDEAIHWIKELIEE